MIAQRAALSILFSASVLAPYAAGQDDRPTASPESVHHTENTTGAAARLSPEYETALRSVQELAAEYSAKSEQELLAMPKAILTEASDKWPMIRIATALFVDEIRLHLKTRQVQNVTRTHQDGRVTEIDFLPTGVTKEALVSDETGRKQVKFWFDADGEDFPRLAVGMTGSTDYQGDLVYWEGPGHGSRIAEIERPLNYVEFIDEVCSVLSAPALDQAGIGYLVRFLNSAAYQNIEYGIVSKLERAMFRAERFRDLTSEPAAVAAAVNGSNLNQIAAEPFIEYEVLASGRIPWRFHFDPQSKRLVRAHNKQKNSAVFFDPDAGYTFFGAAIQFTPPPLSTDHVPGFWLIGFHPARVAPRLLVSCEGESFDAFSVSGHVCLWSPEGKVLFEKKDAAADTLADLLREIDAALTPEEKEAVAWRGMDELPYLIGTY